MGHKGPRTATRRRAPKGNPYAGPTTCLRCDIVFESWDRRQNRLCPQCVEAIEREPHEQPRAKLHPPTHPPRDWDDW